MAHNCKRKQAGHQVCPEHMLTRDGLRYRFRKQMQETFTVEELAEMHNLMKATMLPADSTKALDDLSHDVIDRISKGGVAS